MKTDDLIRALAADDRLHPPRLGLRTGAGAALAFALMALFWQIRADLGSALAQPLVAAKVLLPLALAGLTAWVAQRGQGGWVLALPVLAAAALFVATLPETGLLAAIRGESLWVCLSSIPGLALPIGAGVFWALRHMVLPDPRRAGLLAGLAAGGLAAAIYALHCDEDAPTFYAIWYSAGIALAGLTGRWLGPRWLGV